MGLNTLQGLLQAKVHKFRFSWVSAIFTQCRVVLKYLVRVLGRLVKLSRGTLGQRGGYQVQGVGAGRSQASLPITPHGMHPYDPEVSSFKAPASS